MQHRSDGSSSHNQPIPEPKDTEFRRRIGQGSRNRPAADTLDSPIGQYLEGGKSTPGRFGPTDFRFKTERFRASHCSAVDTIFAALDSRTERIRRSPFFGSLWKKPGSAWISSPALMSIRHFTESLDTEKSAGFRRNPTAIILILQRKTCSFHRGKIMFRSLASPLRKGVRRVHPEKSERKKL